MDLPRLQDLFNRFLQNLFAMGYLERSQFRLFYMTCITCLGFTSEYFSLFHNSSNTTLLAMTQAVAAPQPDFAAVITHAEHLLQSAMSVGALRTSYLIERVISDAQIMHQPGCVAHMELLRFEIMLLVCCFRVISQLETSIAQLGGVVPFDW